MQNGAHQRVSHRGRHLLARLRHHLAATRIAQPFPQAQVTAEFALLVVELGVLLVGLLLRLDRAIAHILHAQGRRDDQHLGHRAALARLQNHPAHAGVERQTRQFLTHRQQLATFIDRAEFAQQLVAVRDRAARRRFEKRKVHHIAQPQRLHAKNHPRQRRTQDFGVGELGTRPKIDLVIQTNTDTVRHAAATAGALVGRSLTDRLDQQLLDLAAERVALHARRAAVDHIANAGNRERGFGHVGGEHDAPARVPVKNPVLLGL